MSLRVKRCCVVCYVVVFLASCSSTDVTTSQKAALTGGALGAGLGAIVGSESGKAGAGVAIGTAAGLLAGGVAGSILEKGEKRIIQNRERISENERALRENRALLKKLKETGLDAKMTDRGVSVNLPDVLFEFNRATLTSSARKTVAKIAEALKETGRRKIYVEGHTDSIGSAEYNLRLSEDRAWAVADELVRNGIRKDDLYIKGFGELRPIASNQTPEGRQRNRRVEVIVGERVY